MEAHALALSGSLDTPSECLYGRNLGFLKKIANTSSTHIMYVELVLSLLFRAMPALAWARVKNFAVELAGLVLECFLSLKNSTRGVELGDEVQRRRRRTDRCWRKLLNVRSLATSRCMHSAIGLFRIDDDSIMVEPPSLSGGNY